MKIQGSSSIRNELLFKYHTHKKDRKDQETPKQGANTKQIDAIKKNQFLYETGSFFILQVPRNRTCYMEEYTK